ncbi:MAG: hypothetical protein WBD20_13350 [Pirellulaceae bacterium]
MPYTHTGIVDGGVGNPDSGFLEDITQELSHYVCYDIGESVCRDPDVNIWTCTTELFEPGATDSLALTDTPCDEDDGGMGDYGEMVSDEDWSDEGEYVP